MNSPTPPPGHDRLPPLTLPAHGGDLAAAEARFGRPRDGWLDLSTGINPFAYPLPSLDPGLWRGLPDSGADLALRLAAAEAWGVADPDAIVIAPGSQALIQALARLVPPTTVAILGPTYAGHADAFARAGHRVAIHARHEPFAAAGVAVVVNPNNPDGRVTAPEELQALAGQMPARNGLLVVDEAFVDLRPELSVAARGLPATIALRSFGKFFGLAGLRLGFAVCAPDLARTLCAALGPWPVSGPALAIGHAALADRAWIEATRAHLAAESDRLDALLAQAGLTGLGGTALFRLAGAERAWALYEHLARLGILVRPFATEPRWLRFGLPPDEAAARRLGAALAAWRG
jgi:cobalamin biosynthetic protein CobC